MNLDPIVRVYPVPRRITNDWNYRDSQEAASSCDTLTLTRVPAPLKLDAKANGAPVFRVRQDPDVAGKDGWNQFVRYDAGSVAVAGQNLRTQHLSMKRRSVGRNWNLRFRVYSCRLTMRRALTFFGSASSMTRHSSRGIVRLTRLKNNERFIRNFLIRDETRTLRFPLIEYWRTCACTRGVINSPGWGYRDIRLVPMTNLASSAMIHSAECKLAEKT